MTQVKPSSRFFEGLHFEAHPCGATWDIRAKDGLRSIGELRWLAASRKYVFVPKVGREFEELQLYELGRFIKVVTEFEQERRRNLM
jgi:hypothetical protein